MSFFPQKEDEKRILLRLFTVKIWENEFSVKNGVFCEKQRKEK